MSRKSTAGAPIDAPHLWMVMMRCYHAMRLVAEESIAKTGLCLTDFAALEALLHKGPLTITEIQDKVLLASGSMTAAVDRLEKKGLLIRTTTTADRRAKVLQLTAEGKRLIEAVFQAHAAELEAASSVLNAAEKQKLYVLLKKLGLFAAGERGKTNDRSSQK